MKITSQLTAFLTLLVAGAALGEDAKPVSDTDFVAKAASGGMFEVASSKLAKDASTSPEVKKFAEHMIADHEKANKELKVAAKNANIEVPTKMSADDQKLYEKVKAAKGAEFDKVYMAAQITAHDEAVAVFSGATKGVKDPGLKAFAEKTLPVIKEHQEHAKKHAMGK